MPTCEHLRRSRWGKLLGDIDKTSAWTSVDCGPEAVDFATVHSKVYELRVAASPEEVWKLLSSPEALLKLTRPGSRLRLLGPAEPVKDGQLQILRVWILGIIPVRWKVRISQVTPPYGFTDQAERSSFKFWRHRHDYIPDGDGTLIRDMIAYIVPFGKFGKAVNRVYVSKELDRQFEYRREVLLKMFGSPS